MEYAYLLPQDILIVLVGDEECGRLVRGGGGQAQQMIDEMANRVDEGVRWAQLLDTCK